MRRLALHTVAAALCLIAVGDQSASAAAPTILSAASPRSVPTQPPCGLK